MLLNLFNLDLDLNLDIELVLVFAPYLVSKCIGSQRTCLRQIAIFDRTICIED